MSNHQHSMSNIQPSNPKIKPLWGGLLGSLALWTASTSYLPPVQAAPFICDGTLYISQAAGDTAPTGLFDVITTINPFGLAARGGADTRYNAMGFRIQDGFIYGIDPGTTPNPEEGGEVFRIDDTGVPVSIGTPPAVQALQAAGDRFIAGDVDTNTGLYYIYSPRDVAPANVASGRIVVLDVTTSPPTVVRQGVLTGAPRFADIAFNPVDGRFYGFDVAAGRIRFFDPNFADGNNTIPVSDVPVGPGTPGTQLGAAFFDASGNFFGYQNSGNLYSVNLATGRFRNLGGAPEVSQNDGAGCPILPLFEKVVEPSSVPLGGTATYRYRVINNTAFSLSNLTFNDIMDGGRAFTAVNSNPLGGTVSGVGTNALTITNLTIPARTTAEITVSVQMPAVQPNPPQLLNQATISGNPPDLIPINATSTDPSVTQFPVPTTVTVQPNPGPAEVTIAKTGPTNLPAPGQATYTITATNQSTTNTAINVVVRDTIATGATFVSASDGGTFAGGDVTWPAFNIPPSGSVTRTVTVELPTDGSFTNTSNVTSDNDVDPGNNGANFTTTVPAAGGNADVVTTKSGPTLLAAPGQASYTVTVTNNGPDTATNVVISDTLTPATLAAGVTFVGASDGGTFNAGTVTWPAISIPNGSTVTRTVTYNLPTAPGNFTNAASNTSDTTDPTPGNNDGTSPDATVTTVIPAAGPADVEIQKTGPANLPSPGQASYTITATNNGPNSATDVVISDNLATGATFVGASDGGTFAGGVVTWPAVNIASIAPDNSVTRTVIVNLPSNGAFTNTSTSTSSSTDPTPGNNGNANPNGSVTTTVPNEPDLAIRKDQTGSYVTGQAAQYLITVSNAGTSPTDGSTVTVTDTLPGDLTPNGAPTGTGWTCNVTGQTITCTRTDVLAGGQSYPQITVPVTVNAAAGSNITNTSTVGGGGDNNPDNNSDPENVIVIGPGDPDLNITKDIDPTTPLVAGGTGNFILTVTNVGPAATAGQVNITDNLPVGLTLNGAATGTGWNCTAVGRTVSCNRNDALLAGTSYPPITIPVRVTAAAGAQITNNASVSGGGDPNIFNNGSTETATIGAGAGGGQIGLVKGVSQPVANGDGTFDIVYTLLVRNFSAVALNNAQVADNLFGDTSSTFNGATSFQVIATPTVTGSLTQGNAGFTGMGNLLSGTETLPAGQSATITLRVRVNPGTNAGPYNNQATATATDPNGNPVSDLSTNNVDTNGDGTPDLNPDPNANGNPGDDSVPTPVTFPIAGGPNLRLVKRITGVTRNGQTLPGVDFGSFVDTTDDNDDEVLNAAGISPIGVPALGEDNPLQSDDVVEYTIYYLSDGNSAVTNARVCDIIRPNTTFVSNSFSGTSGILLRQGTTDAPQTNAADSDRGQFFSPLAPVNSVIPPCPDTNNPDGVVFVNLGDVPNSGTTQSGFVRFRIRLD
ncbi:DUF6923 family protein [Lusitaniella coriacea]|uniref:beta strand repeat-containing protein n=1 Tax=Lusitaniella coriacea TaxID=1983105 RepID=UPI003CF7BAE1